MFCATGIWHGARWNFLFWGLWHGMFIIIERVLIKRNLYDRIPRVVRWPYTIVAIMMGWVMFRADSLNSTWQYLGHLFGWALTGNLQFTFPYYVDTRLILVLAVACVGSVPMFSKLTQEYQDSFVVSIIRIPALLLQLSLCMVFIVNSTYRPFIYFQF